MKNNSFLFIIFISFFACQEDGIFLDGDARTELDIIKIIETTYSNGDIASYKISILENRSLKVDSFYTKNRELISYTKWNYDRDTLLVSVEKFDSLQVLIPEKSKYITFDNQKRITAIATSNNTLNYNYDETDLILGTQTTTILIDSIFINSNQKIYKKITLTEKTELEYVNNRVSKLTNTAENITYSYNTAVPPKGFLWNDIVSNTFKSSNNAVLFYTLHEAAIIYSNNYLSRIANSNGEQNVITYVLVNNEYPKERTSSINGDFRAKTTFFFE